MSNPQQETEIPHVIEKEMRAPSMSEHPASRDSQRDRTCCADSEVLDVSWRDTMMRATVRKR
eukprot:2313605-Rhodomonas_salina.1